ncbi:putative Methylthioadenosine phosphorylase [Leptomonas seymouri]|uniref:Purine nucleoside phosphorylase n=1 Tax=Leptomonas seymouri TaxID=5684 RepID=A0A0N1HYQ0_LEPSE|nr:putative Methylthioadenosine phosphorylase [Leptomonas seymouri]|eukprot:KPI88052.1 putative Methylthioadenosine phosphorylase [Leptomonas seymouri]
MYASPHPEPVVIAVIGGSGVYKLNCLADAKYYDINTPFGPPSAPVCVAKVSGVTCAFLPRHGVHHQYNPSEVNYRANICALKQLGVRYVVAINAAGSLDADYTPGDLVVCDQLVDRTFARKSTFFEKGIVAHVDFAHPMSQALRDITIAALKDCFAEEAAEVGGKFKIHTSGTIVTMEGPQFSTKAESLLNKRLCGHLIGMTTSTEAKLAREAEIAYVTVAMVTDMDAWSDAPHVDTTQVLKTVAANAEKAQRYPPKIIKAISESLFEDPAHNALAYAVMTAPDSITRETRERLAPILGKYPKYAPQA